MNETKDPHDKEIEKLKIKYGFLKFLLGVFAVSVLSLLLNWQIQKKQLQFAMQTQENNYIAQFLEYGLDEQLEKRRDFAAYFVRLSPSKEARERWVLYSKFVEELLNNERETKRNIPQKAEKIILLSDEVAKRQLKAEEDRAELDKLSASSSERKLIEDKLAQSSKRAEEFLNELQEVQRSLVDSRQELASIRSKTIDMESHYPILAGNVAKESEIKSGYWDWTIFIRASDDVLKQIEYVEYKLHSTFPDPVRIVNQRGKGSNAFPLKVSGWGTFTVPIKIYYKDGTYQRLSHSLTFR